MHVGQLMWSKNDWVKNFGFLFQTLRNIEIPIVDDAKPEKDECFEVEIFNPTGGAKLGRNNKTAITITNDDG